MSQEKSISINHDQKWYHLATILSTPFSLPMIAIGHQLSRAYGPGEAICSILVGNLILWLIAMSVISMAREDRSNAIGNVKSYLGKYGAIFMWIILFIAIINWFVHQINAVVPSIGLYFGDGNNSSLVRLGAAIGFFTSLLSMGGIQLLKKLTLYSFPPIFLYYVFTIASSPFSLQTPLTFAISVPAVISTVIVLLPGMVNLPTLYRHSRSKADSVLGLTLMVFLFTFYEISTIWMGLSENSQTLDLTDESSIRTILTLAFIVVTLIYINLINIYFASACWETYIPRFEGPKGYASIGLLGTAAYTFIQINSPIQVIADLTNCYIGNLGVTLIIAFLLREIVHHRPRPLEKTLNGIAWLSGCAVSTIFVLTDMNDITHPMLLGAGITILTFLIILFIEETTWCLRKVVLKT